MSLLGEPAASPSRVRGVFRFMLNRSSDGVERDLLEKSLSPESLIGDGNREMIHGVINECISLGLLVKNGSNIIINEALPKEAKSKITGDQLLPKTIASLIFPQDNPENRELGRAIAWYLTQDAYKAPGNFHEVGHALNVQVGGNKFTITNDARYGQFEDWVVYLGFAWKHSRLTPDPSRYLRFVLREIFGSEGTKLSIVEVLERTAKVAPVFEQGFLRKDVEVTTGEQLIDDHVSSTTAFAWQRLEDDGYVRLEAQSDARVYMFLYGEEKRRVSDIALLAVEGGLEHGV